ncbi:unnamed protein product [Paramecium sonneborni]|uniref:Peptidase A1 domain-containing protein n=1 Tax=Paramecium sonneborni TaxID=65129 RepID=A0A8S1P932_9CILI|nr:unnamed protein product [Paramecium sonneborni]
MFYFSRQEGSRTSELTFGGWNQDHFQGELHFHNVANKFSWLLEIFWFIQRGLQRNSRYQQNG